MNNPSRDNPSRDNPIYALIPAIYRQRDAALDRPLEALTKVLALEYDGLRADIGALYEQCFIETCTQWVVPYIGGLIGVNGIDTPAANVATQRARVANSLGYRARRGIASILANASADASGWPALPVEYFQRIITSVNVEAIEMLGKRPHDFRPASVDVDDPVSLAYLDGPFSTVSRSVSVSAIDRPKLHVPTSTPEYYNLPNLGLFLWRTRALPITAAEPGWGPQRTYRTFHPLGVDSPLLQAPSDRSSPWVPITPANVPLAITRLLLAAQLEAWRRSAESPPLGFTIFVEDQPIPPTNISVPARGQAGLELAATAVPDEWHAVVDPERGRFQIFRAGQAELSPDVRVRVDWAWGQPGAIGGGCYDRNATMFSPTEQTRVLLVSKAHAREFESGEPQVFASLHDAFARVSELFTTARTNHDVEPLEVLIRILDSATYVANHATLVLPARTQVVIQALDGERPCLAAPDGAPSLQISASGEGVRVVLSGVLLASPLALDGDLELLVLDSTLVPPTSAAPQPAITWATRDPDQPDPYERLLQLVRCISGPLELAAAQTHVVIVESILDGAGGLAITGPEGGLGPELLLDAVSVMGDVRVEALTGGRDLIITGKLSSTRIAGELVRDTPSFVLELLSALHEPFIHGVARTTAPFSSTRYGDPGYGQLRLDVGDRLLRGGSDDGELGAYHALATGQRLANLEPVLTDYTPFGLEVGIFIMN